MGGNSDYEAVLFLSHSGRLACFAKRGANYNLGPGIGHHLLLQINFYWNTATAICIMFALLFCNLIRYNRDRVAHKAKMFTLLSGSFKKRKGLLNAATGSTKQQGTMMQGPCKPVRGVK